MCLYIYRHIFYSKLPTKSSFVEKKRPKVGPTLSRKFQITYKIIVCGGKKKKKKRSKLVLYIQKIIEGSILASHVQCLLQKQTSHWVAGVFNAIQHKGDILPIQTCGYFYVSFVYRHCHEQSTCHIVPWIFRQSILSTIDNSTISYPFRYFCIVMLSYMMQTYMNMIIKYTFQVQYKFMPFFSIFKP